MEVPALAVVVLAMGLGLGAFGLGLLSGLGFWALIIGVVVSCIVGYALTEAKRVEGDLPCPGCGRRPGEHHAQTCPFV
ncbi:MAG TPA: hypothetical protein VFB87_05020 [Gaiellaceae bacterium]|nr:hypothetical protein [Gaiellaceae bacterium]